MKIRKGYVLNTVESQAIVVVIGQEALRLYGVVKLNRTGEFLWNLLQGETTEKILAESLVFKYGIGKEQALLDVRDFLKVLQEAGIL